MTNDEFLAKQAAADADEEMLDILASMYAEDAYVQTAIAEFRDAPADEKIAAARALQFAVASKAPAEPKMLPVAEASRMLQ